jgi:hypothetical protein
MASKTADMVRLERLRAGLVLVVAWTIAACGVASSTASGPSAPNDGSVRDGDARPIADATTDGPPLPVDGLAPADSFDENDVPADVVSAGEAGNCAVASQGSFASAAQSAGFSGSDSAYYDLYEDTCHTTTDCVGACTSAGGNSASCAAASACTSESDGHGTCVPPSYWLNVAGALSQSSSVGTPAELVLTDTEYHDALDVSGFGLQVPDDAFIVGLQFDVLLNSDDGLGIDQSIRTLRGGMPVGADRSRGSVWPVTFTYVTYGGPTDTWGTSWQPADVRSPGFGISIAPAYSGSAGNDRAHVGGVKVTLYFVEPCE